MLPVVKANNSTNKWLIYAENNVRILDCTIQGASWFGSYSYINNGFIRSYCEVGRYCSIGRDVSIGLGIHDYEELSTHPVFEDSSSNEGVKNSFVSKDRRVVIGNDCWIGDKVLINSGVTLGDGCIIGAGSVVVKDVEPYSIVGGVPAKHIKYRFSDQIIRKLQEIQWWNYDTDLLLSLNTKDIKIFITSFQSIDNKKKLDISYTKIVPEKI